MAYTTINKSSSYFDTQLWTGTGASGRTFTGLNFQPDFSWSKVRDSSNYYLNIVDRVRGGTKFLATPVTSAEDTASHGQITSWNSDGTTWADGTNVTYPRLYYNDNGTLGGAGSYVAWYLKAGNSAGSSNTNGSITSTVSASQTSGFSIVGYTGTGSVSTIGHGLGIAPDMIIIKNRDQGSGGWNWKVYHSSLGNTKDMSLNRTDAAATTTTFWNNTSPTSTVFTIGTDGVVNTNGNNFIAYCFASIKGFSKAFSYTGNGSSDGTFIYCGFKPAWVMVKASSTTGQWPICDNKRGAANILNNNGEFLFAESAESTNSAPANWDFLSNGLKARAGYAANNTSGVTYIGLAFAENPFVTSGGIPVTAR